MNKFLTCGLYMCMATSLGFCAEVFNFSNSTISFFQNKDAVVHPDAVKITVPVECFDMGSTGTVEIPNVVIPQGPFSIESKFYVRGYNETDPNISEIFAGFNCGNGTEGIDFRVGGGYNYALKIKDVYNKVSDWSRPDGFEKTARANISKAMGEFCLGSGLGAWKEVFTDRCIETNKWVHMVATWDGTKMRIYLNGHNATDTWRTVGSDLPAYIMNSRTIIIGAETIDAWRHFNGMISFVKIYNEAFSPQQVWQNYKKSIGNDRCNDFIKIESPQCGEVISPKTKFKFTIKDSADSDVLRPSQAFTIQLCKDPSFSTTVRSYSLSDTPCVLEDIVGKNNNEFNGLFYYRIVTGNQSALGKKSVGTLVAESGTLATYLDGPASSILEGSHQRTIFQGSTGAKRLANTSVVDLRGRMVGTESNLGATQLKNGIYFVKGSNGVGKKILYTK